MTNNKQIPNPDDNPCCSISRQTDANTLEVKTPSRINFHKKKHSKMIPIKGGNFLMGSDSKAVFKEDGEGPVREIEIESSKGKISSQKISDFAAGYQEGIVDSLVSKTVEAVKEHYANGIIIGGGVASNQLLREEIADKSPVPVFIPRPNLCTDNGAMIAMTGWIKFKEKPSPQWDLDVIPGLKIG